MKALWDLDAALSAIETVDPRPACGRVTELVGLAMRATVPKVRTGDLVVVENPDGGRLRAEAIGFRGNEVLLVPLGDTRGLGPQSVVHPTGRPLELRCGEPLLGRILDGLGESCDGRGPIPVAGTEPWALDRRAPDPLERRPIDRPLALGVRAIDALLTVGEGQRLALVAAAGAGKSMLLGQFARNTAADVNVICLCGERGRELRDFVRESLGADGLARSVVVCATADAPPQVRVRSAFAATAVAEWFRARGARVLFLMDSLSRLARAQREIGLAIGEPPGRQGYPPSVFALLQRLLERTGNDARGSITAIYTVLATAGDLDEPVADEARAILDGHIVLSRELAARAHYPAIDVLRSLSRLMSQISDRDQLAAAAALRRDLAICEEKRDLIALGAYQPGSDPATDLALAQLPDVERFLRQRADERPTVEASRAALCTLYPPPAETPQP
jgi:type III secretion protein N (ATPase)